MSLTESNNQEPTPPTDLAKYICEPVARQDPPTLRTISEWARELAAYRERQSIETDEDEEIVHIEDEGSEEGGPTIVSKKIPCGPGCNGCPHGPYDYAVQRTGDGLSWEYLGKTEDR